jgi:signal transduction histidine kinase
LGGRSVKADVTVYPMGHDGEDYAGAIVRLLPRHESDAVQADNECLRRLHAIRETIEKLKNEVTSSAELDSLRLSLQQNLDELALAANDSEAILKEVLAGRESRFSELNRTFKETLDNCQDILNGVGLQVEYLDGQSPCPIPENQLKLAFWNLLANAAEAIRMSARASGGRIVVTLGRVNLAKPPAGILLDAMPGEYWTVCFADNGIGMDDVTAARIFEPFFTTKKGCGLGLVLVYNLLKEHGGQIAVDSAPGNGSRFTLYLPTA